MTKEMLNFYLRFVPLKFIELIKRIPPYGENDYLPPYWLHLELIERYRILQHANIVNGMNVLEVGSGPHALTTIPLAFLIGDNGHLVAIEYKRWGKFKELLNLTKLAHRVSSLSCDARNLPFVQRLFDMSFLVHGLRSFKNEETIISVFKEMLRVSNKVFIAATIPTAKTKGQLAHIKMYNLRQEIFEHLHGIKEDLHYFSLKKIIEMVNRAGGRVIERKVIDVDMPHFLGFIPKKYIMQIEDVEKRKDLLQRWEEAYEYIKKYGEEHPPVGIITFVPER